MIAYSLEDMFAHFAPVRIGVHLKESLVELAKWLPRPFRISRMFGGGGSLNLRMLSKMIFVRVKTKEEIQVLNPTSLSLILVS